LTGAERAWHDLCSGNDVMTHGPRTVAEYDAVVPALLASRERLARWRRAAVSYLQVLAGSFGRLGVQAVYFLVLANTLPLGDMGVFASTCAAGIMIGCFVGLGFSSFAFRAAAGRRGTLGAYMALVYATGAATVPFGLLVALVPRKDEGSTSGPAGPALPDAVNGAAPRLDKDTKEPRTRCWRLDRKASKRLLQGRSHVK
jgi:hypothetical protein